VAKLTRNCDKAIPTDVRAIEAPGDHAKQEEQIANEVSVVSCTWKQHQHSPDIIFFNNSLQKLD